MIVTGRLLFYAIPVRSYHNVFFRIKAIMLVLAGLNAFVFHNGIYRKVFEWDVEPRAPRAARAAGACSLVLWALIIVSGRMIAYNWFDCDMQPPGGRSSPPAATGTRDDRRLDAAVLPVVRGLGDRQRHPTIDVGVRGHRVGTSAGARRDRRRSAGRRSPASGLGAASSDGWPKSPATLSPGSSAA